MVGIYSYRDWEMQACLHGYFLVTSLCCGGRRRNKNICWKVSLSMSSGIGEHGKEQHEQRPLSKKQHGTSRHYRQVLLEP